MYSRGFRQAFRRFSTATNGAKEDWGAIKTRLTKANRLVVFWMSGTVTLTGAAIVYQFYGSLLKHLILFLAALSPRFFTVEALQPKALNCEFDTEWST
jgi:hypothetical protein